MSIWKRAAACIMACAIAGSGLPVPTAHGAVQAEFYVSPTGVESNPGTINQPTTLEGAKNKVRAINGGMTGDIRVYLRDGIYNLSSTFALTERDSGTNGNKVMYMAYPNEKPRLEGGVKITNWVQDGSRYKAVVSGLSDTRQLWVNGNRAQRARTVDLKGAGWYGEQEGISLYTSDLPASIARPADLEWVMNSVVWKQYRAAIESVHPDPTFTGFKFNPAAWSEQYFNSGAPYPGTTGTMFLENALEFLDQPGEWYYDTSTSTMYYIPRPGETMSTATVYASRLQTLVSLGGASPALKLHNVEFHGIVFRHGGWLQPNDEGAITYQSTYLHGLNSQDYVIPGSVTVKHANNVRFVNNEFRETGASGLVMSNAVTNSSIIGNVFYDIAAAAIDIGDPDHRTIQTGEEAPKNITVNNNLLRYIGVEYSGSAAINAFYVDTLTISHNDIAYTDYSGISVGWGWEIAVTPAKNNVISNNRLAYVMRKSHDGGGIYSLGNMPGSSYTGNYVKNISGWTHTTAGLYHDASSSGFTDSNNVVELDRPDSLVWGVYTSDAITITDTYSNGGSYVKYNSTANTLIEEIITSAGSWPTEAQTIISNSGLQAAYADIQAKIPADPAEPSAPGPFQQEIGQPVVMEAENYHGYKGRESTTVAWTGFNNYFSGYSGDSALIPYPDKGEDYGNTTNGPMVSFDINFKETGTFYVFVRGKAPNSGGDSIHVGLNGSAVTTATGGMTGWNTNNFAWQTDSGLQPVKVTVPTIGNHKLTIWAKEDGFLFDKIVLSRDSDYILEGDTSKGPRESHHVGEPVPPAPVLRPVQPPPAFNLASGKAATASSSVATSYDAAKAVDNNYRTEYVSAYTGTPYWQVDLGSAHQIGAVKIVFRTTVNEASTRRNFEVRASNDSTFASSVVLGSKDSVSVPFLSPWSVGVTSTTAYRYIRIVKTAAEPLAFSEVRVTGKVGSNVALNKTVTATGQTTDGAAANLVDDSLSTRWAGEGYPKSATISLGQTYVINKTELSTYENRAYKYKIEVATSSSGPFTTIVDKTANNTNALLYTDTFQNINANYVRLTILGANGYNDAWASVNELKVFGH
ncbi:discoidin domain-containing protein [Paenibacillus sp. GCM10023252]|uniref:discoidin domain-containing protein n=1 Tax=Paenibacillus sp. GCM10023252 TaxID=3252649 RepID=UPI0036085E82